MDPAPLLVIGAGLLVVTLELPPAPAEESEGAAEVLAADALDSAAELVVEVTTAVEVDDATEDVEVDVVDAAALEDYTQPLN